MRTAKPNPKPNAFIPHSDEIELDHWEETLDYYEEVESITSMNIYIDDESTLDYSWDEDSFEMTIRYYHHR